MTIYAVIGGFVAFLAAIFGAYRQGYKTAKSGAEIRELKGYAQTRKAIDDADAHSSDDAGVTRELLRARSDKRDGNL